MDLRVILNFQFRPSEPGFLLCLFPHTFRSVGGWVSASSALLFRIWSLTEMTQRFCPSGPLPLLGLNLWETRLKFFLWLNITLDYPMFTTVEFWQARIRREYKGNTLSLLALALNLPHIVLGRGNSPGGQSTFLSAQISST